MLKLIFTGKLRPGLDRDTVIAKLATLLKQPPDVVRERLFAGKAVVIKRVATDDEAQKWRQAFARAGAELTVKDEAPASSHKPAEAPAAPRAPQPETPQTKRRHQRAYVWFGSIALVLIVTTLTGLWLTRPLWQSPSLEPGQRALARALMMDHAYALGHMDLARITDLAALAGMDSDLDALPGAGDDFWASLSAAGLNPREQVDHLWLAGFYDGEDPQAVLVATGRFAPEVIAGWLRQRYLVEDQGNSEQLVFTWLDEQTCSPGPPLLAHLTDTLVVIGEAERVEQFLQRLEAGTEPAMDLSRWDRVSANQAASLAVFVPDQMAHGISGMPGMMLRGVGQMAAPAEGLYLGAEPVALPPGFEVSALVGSSDERFVEQSFQAMDHRLSDMRSDAAETWPETLPLYNRVSVQKHDQGVRAAVRFDRHFRRDISNWVDSIFGSLFSSGDNSHSGEDLIDENAPVFADLATTELPAYGDYRHIQDYFFRPSVETGPFALGIEEVSIRADGGVDLALGAQAYDLPNLPSEGSAVRLSIVDVVGPRDESLLPAPECGPDNNREPGDINNRTTSSTYVDGEAFPYVKVAGSKTLNLPAGTSLADISEIRGEIHYLQPTTIDRVTMSVPLDGQTMEKHGLRVRFLGDGTNSLRYQYSGDTDKLLHVYARNKDGKPLSSGGSVKGKAFFGGGKTASVDYRGTIASVELVMAAEMKEHRFPFSLSSVYPTPRGIDNPSPQPQAMTREQWQQLLATEAPAVTYNWQEPQQEQVAGPARLAFTELDIDSNFGLRVSVDTYLDNTFPLVGPLGAGTLTLSAVEDDEGVQHPLALSSAFSFAHDGGHYFNGEYQPDDARPWVKGSADFRAREIELDNSRRLHGELRLSAPMATRTERLPFSLGARWENPELTLTITKWKGSELKLTHEGDLSSLVAVRAYAGDTLVSQTASVQQTFGESEIVMEIGEQPTHLAIELAEEMEQQRYPFVLELNGE